MRGRWGGARERERQQPFEHQQLHRSPPQLAVSICSSRILRGIVWSRRGYTPATPRERKRLRISFGGLRWRPNRNRTDRLHRETLARSRSLRREHHCAAWTGKKYPCRPLNSHRVLPNGRKALNRQQLSGITSFLEISGASWGAS